MAESVKKSKSGGRPLVKKLPQTAAWLYHLLTLFASLLLLLLFSLRIRVDSSVRALKGPVNLLGIHPSYLDPLIMAAALWPRKIRFMTSRDFFRGRFASVLLHKVGAIPKTQFRTDMQAIKTVLGTLQSGGAVAIYPEGQRSIDGRLQPVDESLFKQIKKAGCPVVMGMEQGAYLAWPRRAKGLFRPGRVHVSASLLLDRDAIKLATPAGLRQTILKSMAYNDYDLQKIRPVRYRSRRPAAGMSDICHQCPSCGRELAMKTIDRAIICRNCGNQGLVDTTGLIRPAPAAPGAAPCKVWSDVASWHRWQLNRLKKAIKHDSFKRTFPATLSWPDEPEIKQPVTGTLVMTAQELSFYARIDQAAEHTLVLSIPLKNRSGVSAKFGSYFDLVYADRLFRFTVQPGQAVILLADYIYSQEN